MNAIRRYTTVWRHPEYFWSLGMGVLVFVAGLACIAAARVYLSHEAIHQVSSPDLLLDVLP